MSSSSPGYRRHRRWTPAKVITPEATIIRLAGSGTAIPITPLEKGHGFSRAAQSQKMLGFSPEGFRLAIYEMAANC